MIGPLPPKRPANKNTGAWFIRLRKRSEMPRPRPFGWALLRAIMGERE